MHQPDAEAEADQGRFLDVVDDNVDRLDEPNPVEVAAAEDVPPPPPLAMPNEILPQEELPQPVPQQNGRLQRRVQLPLHLRIHDNRVYHISRRDLCREIIYLRCRNCNICGGSAKIRMNAVDVIVPIRPHTDECMPDRYAQLIQTFKNALKEALRTHWYRLKELYDTLATVHVEASALVTFYSVRASMIRWRRQLYPPAPTSLEQFIERLSQVHDGEILEYTRGRLRYTRVTDTDQCIHLALYDLDFLRADCRDVHILLIDSTYGITPRVAGCYQVLTVMGIKYNHAIPLFYVVMSRKTEVAYFACLSKFSDVLRNLNVDVILVDFETALRRACHTVYPEARIAGCNTHFDRAVYQKIRQLGLQNIALENEEVRSALEKFVALPFLPWQDIEAVMNTTTLLLTPETSLILRDFINYFNNQWIRGVTPKNFSIFGLERRTTNSIESYHFRLNQIIKRHPSAWEFIVWRLYASRLISSDELLRIVMYLKGDLSMRLQANARLDHEIGRRYEAAFDNFDHAGLDPEFDRGVVNHHRIQPGDYDRMRNLLNNIIPPAELNVVALPNEDMHVQGNRNDLHAEQDAEHRFDADDDVIGNNEVQQGVLRGEAENVNLPEIEVPRRPIINRRYNRRPYERNVVNQDGPHCVCCLIERPTVAFVPCGHRCCCSDCVVIVFANNPRRCPVCRTAAELYVRVFDL